MLVKVFINSKTARIGKTEIKKNIRGGIGVVLTIALYQEREARMIYLLRCITQQTMTTTNLLQC